MIIRAVICCWWITTCFAMWSWLSPATGYRFPVKLLEC